MSSSVPFRDDAGHCCTYALNTQCTASPSLDRIANDCTHNEFFNLPLTLGAYNNPAGYDVNEYIFSIMLYVIQTPCFGDCSSVSMSATPAAIANTGPERLCENQPMKLP
jgi:hypothetical protein